MDGSSLSTDIRKTGNILRKSASDQIIDYKEHFQSIRDLYDKLLVNLIVSKFDYKKAYETVMNFFGSNKVKFAAVDGAEFKRALSLKNPQWRRNLRSQGNSL